MGKTILVGSAVALGVFALLFLVSPIFTGFGFGSMMGERYSSQNWGPRACPAVSSYDEGYRNGGWGMMGNWR